MSSLLARTTGVVDTAVSRVEERSRRLAEERVTVLAAPEVAVAPCLRIASGTAALLVAVGAFGWFVVVFVGSTVRRPRAAPSRL